MTADTLTRALATIDAAAGRADAATPGPIVLWEGNSWRRFGSEATGRAVIEPTTQRDGHPDMIVSRADATFYTAARTDVPLLAAAARALAGLTIEGTAMRRGMSHPWWSGAGACLWCYEEPVRFDDWASLTHAPDCPALAADAALAALAGDP